MAFATSTISGDLADFIGTDYDENKVSVVLEASDPIVTDGVSQVRVGNVRATITAGVFSFVGVPNTVAGSPSYSVRITWTDAGTRKQREVRVGWFAVTADVNLAAIVDDVYTPVSITPTVAAQIEAAAALGDNNNTMTAGFVTGAGPTQDALKATFAAIDGTPRTVKPLGDGKAGILDWKHDDDTGYLLHLRSGPNTAGGATIGIGTDEGSGSGLVISHKNAGIGQSVAVNPSATGVGVDVRGYSQSANGFVYHAHANTPGMLIESATGAAYKDGVSNGTTTFTSATAAFVAGDVGKAFSQLTSTPTTPSVIPPGTTIASVTNGTTVVLSAAVPAATNIQFLVAGRLPSSGSQPLTIRPAMANQKALAVRKSADAFDTVQVYENGAINFGAGTVATDVNLYRATNGRLGTDHQFLAVQGVATRVISGAGKTTVADADFARTPPDGMTVIVLNTTDSTSKLACRVAGAWKYGAGLS